MDNAGALADGRVIHVHRDVDLDTAEQVDEFSQHFQADGDITIDVDLVLVGDQLTQGGHIVVVIAALGLGHAVDAVVAGDAGVGGDHRVTGDLQHLQFARFVVEMDVQDHIGHAVVDVGVVGGTGGQVARGGTIHAGDKDIQLFILEFLGGVDQLVQLDAAALGGDSAHDERIRAAEDQHDHQQGDEQDLPPGAFLFLLFAAVALAAFFAVRLGVGGVTVTRGLAAAAVGAMGAGGGFVLMVGLVGAGRFFHLDASGGGGCLVIIKGGAAALHLVHIQLLHLRTRAAGLGGTITVDGALLGRLRGPAGAAGLDLPRGELHGVAVLAFGCSAVGHGLALGVGQLTGCLLHGGLLDRLRGFLHRFLYGGLLADLPGLLLGAHGLLDDTAAGVLVGLLLGAAAGSLVLGLVKSTGRAAGIELTRFAHYVSSLFLELVGTATKQHTADTAAALWLPLRFLQMLFCILVCGHAFRVQRAALFFYKINAALQSVAQCPIQVLHLQFAQVFHAGPVTLSAGHIGQVDDLVQFGHVRLAGSVAADGGQDLRIGNAPLGLGQDGRGDAMPHGRWARRGIFCYYSIIGKNLQQLRFG